MNLKYHLRSCKILRKGVFSLMIGNRLHLSGIVHIGTLEILDGKSYPAFWVNLSNSPLKIDPIDELVTEVEFSPWFYCNFLNFFRYIYLIMSGVYARRRSTWFDPLHQSHGSSKFVWMCHRIWAILTPRYPMWIFSTKVARAANRKITKICWGGNPSGQSSLKL